MKETRFEGYWNNLQNILKRVPSLFQAEYQNTFLKFPKTSCIWKINTLNFPCRNAKELKATKEYIQTFNGKTARLKIFSATPDTAGMYKVIFKNSAGSDESSAELKTGNKITKFLNHQIFSSLGFLFLFFFFSLFLRYKGKMIEGISFKCIQEWESSL